MQLIGLSTAPSTRRRSYAIASWDGCAHLFEMNGISMHSACDRKDLLSIRHGEPIA
ncbi:MAG: hypothetical protein AAGH76_00025 [Pseudomonadota bacterium]